MSQLREAAQAVLDRWDSPRWEWSTQGPTADLMADLRAALAEPVQDHFPDVTKMVQEPIGYLWPTGRHPEFRFTQQKRDGVDGTPVYTSPPQRKPLTEEEIEEINRDLPLLHMQAAKGSVAVIFARAIERAHGIGSEA